MSSLSFKKMSLILVRLVIYFNIIVCFHAYKFTHYSNNDNQLKSQSPNTLSIWQKFTTLIFGIDNPRPNNLTKPSQQYQTIILDSNKKIELWQILTPNSKGTVAIFHGYGGSKSAMLDKSNEFIKMGYSTILVDFMGSGGSTGNQTTIGYDEAIEVKSVYEYMKSINLPNIYLFGTSMGSVAIMKALADYPQINPKGIIIECPFGSMYQTTINRFIQMNVPAVPVAGLLVFWGGIINGFWAFSHKPTEYAKSIHVPTMLMYGEEDKNVSRIEINDIYNNLKTKKSLVTFKNAGHNNYLIKYQKEWYNSIQNFLQHNQ